MSAAHNPPAFSFYANDFLTGTMTLTLADRGAYITLLAYQWDHGSIPDDPSVRARVLGCTRREATLAWDHLAEKFTRVADGWRNLRLEEERAKQIARHAALAENGQRGASRRWQKPPRDDGTSYSQANGQANSQANSRAIAGPIANTWQSDGLPSSVQPQSLQRAEDSGVVRQTLQRAEVSVDARARGIAKTPAIPTIHRGSHRAHAWCSERMCVPEFLHEKFLGAIGNQGTDTTLRAFYADTMAHVPEAQAIDTDPLKFWPPHVAARWPPAAAAIGSRTAALRRATADFVRGGE